MVGSYSLATAAAAPLLRRIMDLVDAGVFMIASLILSAGGGAISGSANDMPTVIGGRVLMGVGMSGGYLA
jgi:MFS family permease